MINSQGYSLDEAKCILQRVADLLAKQGWFRTGKWTTSVHYFPSADAPESVTLHVSKPHWFNDGHQGIHFEAGLSRSEWTRGEVPLVLHLFHTALVPGTKIKRIAVSKPFIDSVYARVAGWKGYTFRAGKYGTHPFTVKIPFDETFEQSMSDEMAKLCRELGPAIDDALKLVLV